MRKMVSDGYFDMSMYISGKINKQEMYAKLVSVKSKYAALYQGNIPTRETAWGVWNQTLGQAYYGNEQLRLSSLESSAIVNWVYMVQENHQQRIAFTLQLLRETKRFHGIAQDVKIAKGVVYNAEKVELHFLTSVASVNQYIAKLNEKGKGIYYRGHSNPNYLLQPSIKRTKRLEKNESKMYNELLINCPEDFEKCHTHLEKLVKMQHYGLPTRLLDITRNPLVALYFACESHPESYGELVLISPDKHSVKYPQSDTVSVVACLPAFSRVEQRLFANAASDPRTTDEEFNQVISRLLSEVRMEKPAFQAVIKKEDLLKSHIVLASKNNNRIVKQDGAFILCGLSDDSESLEEFRYKEDGKKVVVLIDDKPKVLRQLETFSVTHATLFPEIECVAEYLKNKYT